MKWGRSCYSKAPTRSIRRVRSRRGGPGVANEPVARGKKGEMKMGVLFCVIRVVYFGAMILKTIEV